MFGCEQSDSNILNVTAKSKVSCKDVSSLLSLLVDKKHVHKYCFSKNLLDI